MVSSFHPHSMCKKVERVKAKPGCTSCTKRTISFEVSGFHTKTSLLQRLLVFFTYYNSTLFVHSVCTIQSHVINFQPFLTSFAIFHRFTDFFELTDPEIEKHYKWTLNRLKLGMVSSFHPHSMCKRVEMVTAKTGCTSCTKWTISFEVSGFRTKDHLLQRDFIFLNLFELHSFSVFKMPHSKAHLQFSTLSVFICYFSCIYWFFWAIRPWNWKALQMNSEKVESWHSVIISPT